MLDIKNSVRAFKSTNKISKLSECFNCLLKKLSKLSHSIVEPLNEMMKDLQVLAATLLEDS